MAADDRDGARQMVRYLRDPGRRGSRTITGPLDTPGGVDRLAGYRERARRRRATSALVADGDYTPGQRRGARWRELLERAPDLDAVFVASDLMAAGALARAARGAAAACPRTSRSAASTTPRIATRVEPALTTIRQPFDRIAQEMVRMLLDLIDGQRRPRRMTLPTELVRRESA